MMFHENKFISFAGGKGENIVSGRQKQGVCLETPIFLGNIMRGRQKQGATFLANIVRAKKNKEEATL